MALPLAGLKIIDLTRALAGPFASMILADLGADVIKIEPLAGDMTRHWGPFDQGISAYYLAANRNKRGVAVNFREERGLSLIRTLIQGSDAVLENFKTGTMESMGMGYDTLSSANPALVFGSITGFGKDGPLGHWPGFDQIAQGYSGLMSLTGMPESGPTRCGVAIGDLTTGMWSAMGVLAALLARQRDGHGQRVDTSLLGSLVGLLSVQGQRYLSLNEVPGQTGNDHSVIAPYGVFQTADGPLNLAPATPQMWTALCRMLDLESLITDPRFVDNTQRMRHRSELKALVESRLALASRATWTARMIEAGIPAGPINSLDDVFADAQVVHSRLVEEVGHPVLGSVKQLANPIKLESMTNGSVRSHPPMLGEHTVAVLTDFGFSESDIEAMRKDGVIAQYS